MLSGTVLSTFVTFVLLLGLGSCSQSGMEESGRLPEGRYPVEIGSVTLDSDAFEMFATPEGSDAAIPAIFGGSAAGDSWGDPSTRVSETGDGSGSRWDGGEQITVQLEDGTLSARYTVQSDCSATAVGTPIYWPTPETQRVKAWYPATDGKIDLGDQRDQLRYVLAGSGTGDYRNPVTLAFSHALSKLRITFSGSALLEVQSASVWSVTACTSKQGAISGALSGTGEGWVKLKRCDYTIEGEAVTCWEANVVPGTEISRVLVNDLQEISLTTPVTPEAGKLHNVAMKIEFPALDYEYDRASNTYTVYNEAGLHIWADAARKDLASNCILAADIVLTPPATPEESNWTPVGSYYTDDNCDGYIGTFDGGGHTITGLTINLPEQLGVGMFGVIGEYGSVESPKGTVKNLTLAEVEITGSDCVGGVAGLTCKGSLTGCSIEGTVSGTGFNVGGVVGYNNFFNNSSYVGNVFLTDCTFSGDVSGSQRVGGVVGVNETGGTVENCRYISGTVSGSDYVGGVAGWNNSGTVTACYATGNVTGTGSNVGGVVGCNYDTVTACYWSNNCDAGVGSSSYGSSETTKVDGTNVTWQTAQSGMNAAIETWNAGHSDKWCDWKFRVNPGPDPDPAKVPLILESRN